MRWPEKPRSRRDVFGILSRGSAVALFAGLSVPEPEQVRAVSLGCDDSGGRESADLVKSFVFITSNDPDLKLMFIPAYTPDGTKVLIHGYELAAMSEDERWDWANQWLNTWPGGRELFVSRLKAVNQFCAPD